MSGRAGKRTVEVDLPRGGWGADNAARSALGAVPELRCPAWSVVGREGAGVLGSWAL